MDIYSTEQEQLEAIKKWLREYAKYIMGAIIVVLAISYGWRYWQQEQMGIHGQASMLFEQGLAAMATNNPAEFQPIAQQLTTQYKSTPYAKLAALLLAKQFVDAGKLDAALAQLNWVIENADNSSLKQIARIRAARILLAQQNAKQALALLQPIDNTSYLPLINEVKGDILLAMQQPQQARQAYMQALNLLPADAATRPLVQMKVNQLAG